MLFFFVFVHDYLCYRFFCGGDRDGWFSFSVIDAYYMTKTIHNDLKSENMLIFDDDMFKVADFSHMIVKF